MTKLVTHSRHHHLSPTTHLLSRKMLSPLCGLVQEIGFLRLANHTPKIQSTSADLTGVHVLLDKPHPGRRGYHVSAAGISLDEVLIKTLGASIERYAQLVSEISDRFLIKFLSYSQLCLSGRNCILPESGLHLFGKHQFKQLNFPLACYRDQPLGWIRLPSLLSTNSMWVPAQFVLVGYQVKHALNEPWIAPAVTTGTAAHTNKVTALLNSVLEIIQIDSAMGHWYTARQAKRIIFDDRTRSLNAILARESHFNPSQFIFYWLENPDLAGFSIACVYRDQQTVPKIAIGLGADVSLIKAMYKAYLETISIIGLSRKLVFQKKIAYTDNPLFYDLDNNVAYYASGCQQSFIDEKFPLNKVNYAMELPMDIHGSESKQLSVLISSFKNSNKELLFCDLTCVEAADLGFVVPRVWSPDTLSLCLPSAPCTQHPRYQCYGGLTHELPHPYP